ncbi:hypothetical protein [Nostoc sp. C117]|uniref:hypothetical protein n=1 Tax=Nostoc sp. C117 TaxID=3349875 RepID=UPI00370DB7AC
MRVRQPCADHELELQLIHESPLELTFQKGNIPQLIAIKTARKNLLVNTIKIGAVILFLFGGFIYQSILHGIKQLLPISNLQFFALIAVLLLISLIYVMFSPCFLLWIFDQTNKQLVEIKTNLLAKQQKRTFKFSEIEAINVQEDYDDSFQCTELYLVLKSGKEFTLSQSSYSLKTRNKAIALKYHREIAEKMRSFLGWDNEAIPINERAEAVYIPTEEEIKQDIESNLKMVKETLGTLFSSKAKKQEKIQELHSQINQDPSNPETWESLAMILGLQRNTLQECIDAFVQAESLYRQRGDIDKANKMEELIKRAKN